MSVSLWPHIALLSLCWTGYFALHSALASLAVKSRVAAARPDLMPYYRLMFNAVALLLILPILWLSFVDPGPALWRWTGAAAWLANGLATAAICCFFLTLKDYDMQEFLGLRQLRADARQVADQEHFHLSPFHRHVRHPWYFFSLVVIWTRDFSAATLLSGAIITLYFVIGSRLEENKLLIYHGEAYRRYMARVPGLIPLPGKSLSTEEAAALVRQDSAGGA